VRVPYDLGFRRANDLHRLHEADQPQAMIIAPENAMPRCTAIVDLISRVFRPYLFMVTVSGEPPHVATRRYRILAPDEDSAAISGIRLFVQEFMPRAVRAEMATLEPMAKLQ
jgi:hypothetical protein